MGVFHFSGSDLRFALRFRLEPDESRPAEPASVSFRSVLKNRSANAWGRRHKCEAMETIVVLLWRKPSYVPGSYFTPEHFGVTYRSRVLRRRVFDAESDN